MISKLADLVGPFSGKSVCLLGLSFKPDTDDIRDAPSLEMIEALLAAGASVKAYDPVANDHAHRQFPDIICCEDPYTAAESCDAIVLMTEWNEFRNIDLPRLQKLLVTPKFLDCRNIYEPQRMSEIGFEYVSVGRKSRMPEDASEELDWTSPGRFVPLRR